MWPWEHVAVAYLAYSALTRTRWGRPPDARGAVVVAVASVLPDLVDKPLAWWLAVLPSGRSLGHSLLVAAPVVAAVLLAGYARGERPVAVAYALGHLSHLAGDVAYPLLVEGELRVGFLLWPVVAAPAGGTERALPHLQDLVAAFVAFLATPRGTAYLVADVALLAVALAAWLRDGHPGLGRHHSDGPGPVRD